MLPIQANPGDAGMDLYSIEAVEIPAGVAKLIKTGIQIELPKERKPKFDQEVD